jgi:hypothetical protein
VALLPGKQLRLPAECRLGGPGTGLEVVKIERFQLLPGILQTLVKMNKILLVHTFDMELEGTADHVTLR